MTHIDNVTITTPTGTTTPVLWMELDARRQATTVLHQTVSGGTVVMHGPAPTSRATVLMFLYDDEAASRAAENMLAAGGVCSITAPNRVTHEMSFVVVGEIARILDPDTANVWIVTAEVAEVIV